MLFHVVFCLNIGAAQRLIASLNSVLGRVNCDGSHHQIASHQIVTKNQPTLQYLDVWLGAGQRLNFKTHDQYSIAHYRLDDHTQQSWYLIIAITSVGPMPSPPRLRDRLPMLKFFLSSSCFTFRFWAWPVGRSICLYAQNQQSQIAKNPKLKGKDLKNTVKAAKIQNAANFVINFVEGSRLTDINSQPLSLLDEAESRRYCLCSKHLRRPI